MRCSLPSREIAETSREKKSERMGMGGEGELVEQEDICADAMLMKNMRDVRE